MINLEALVHVGWFIGAIGIMYWAWDSIKKERWKTVVLILSIILLAFTGVFRFNLNTVDEKKAIEQKNVYKKAENVQEPVLYHKKTFEQKLKANEDALQAQSKAKMKDYLTEEGKQ